MTTIPIIDISALSGNDEVQKLKLVNKLGDTARNIGFFLVENHGISHEDIQKVYDQAKRFFALPIEEKMQFYIAKNPTHRGYVPFTEKGDYPDEISRNYEAFDLGMELEPALRMTQGSRLVGSNVWPDLLEFREIVYGYFQNVANVGMQICTALEHYLGLKQGSITAQMQQPISQLRLLHYINLETAGARSVNMGAHTDYECLTILHTANEGLQISPKTGEWIDVPVRPDAFVVNIGDMMEAFSNGVFRSTLHRVINEQPERYSLPYFLAPNYDTVIRPLPELLQGKNSEYEHYRFTAGEHLERMLKRDFPYLRDNETKCPSENLISPIIHFSFSLSFLFTFYPSFYSLSYLSLLFNICLFIHPPFNSSISFIPLSFPSPFIHPFIHYHIHHQFSLLKSSTHIFSLFSSLVSFLFFIYLFLPLLFIFMSIILFIVLFIIFIQHLLTHAVIHPFFFLIHPSFFFVSLVSFH